MAFSLIFCHGFDTMSDLTKTSWNTFGIDCVTDLTGTKSRTGLGCLIIRPGAFGPAKVVTPGTNFLMTTAYRPNGSPAPGNQGYIMKLADAPSGKDQVSIMMNANLSISVWNGNSPFPIVLGTSAPGIININSYNYITAKCLIAASGSVVVRVNGVIVLSVTGQTAATGSTGKADTFQLMTYGTLFSYHDDVTLWGWTAAGDDIVGAPSIYPFLPSADSTPLEWTPSVGVDHFPLVSSVPQDLTKFNSDGTPGDEDQYIHSLPPAQNVPPFPAVPQILAVQHDLLMDVDSGAGSAASDVGSVIAAPFALTNGFKQYSTPYTVNPVSGLAWDITDFPTLGIGPVVA